jgi:NADH dehydrogenase
VIVDEHLNIPEHDEVFVIGDAAAAKDQKGETLPGLAPVAVQQGRYVANLLRRKIPKDQRKPFKYFDKGTMATIGKTKAVGMFGKLQFYGFFAWLGWCFVHILYLIGFRNRLIVLTRWLLCYFSPHRGARLIKSSLDERLAEKHSKK